MTTLPSLFSEDLPLPRRVLLTDDSKAILRFAADGAERGLGAALVTLVEVRGGSARAVGAQMAIHGDGSFCGVVSGGCTEAAVAAEAVAAIRHGTDRYLRLGEGSPFFDIVLPCGGGITLSIHILRQSKVVRQILDALAARKRVSLTYSPARQSLSVNEANHHTGWKDGDFIRGYRPDTRLILCGASVELETTARVAAAAGFDLKSYDGHEIARPDLPAIDEDTAVGLLYHDIDKELPMLRFALSASPFYIGALGSQRTHSRRCRVLWDLGYSKEDTDRIRAPIGLFGKARDANSLALSVLAEVAAVRSNL
jgi:xanthine dehydrogenase accessory factor